MKKSSLLVLAVSFVALSALVSDAQAKPTLKQKHCHTVCPKGSDADCYKNCMAQCTANCNLPKKPTADDIAAYKNCIDGGCNAPAPAESDAPASN